MELVFGCYRKAAAHDEISCLPLILLEFSINGRRVATPFSLFIDLKSPRFAVLIKLAATNGKQGGLINGCKEPVSGST